VSHSHGPLEKGELVDIHRFRNAHEIGDKSFEYLGNEVVLEAGKQCAVVNIPDTFIDARDALNKAIVEEQSVVRR
jgi:hypothetical protein